MLIIAYAHGFIILMSIIAFIVRYKKNPQAFYLNYLLYILFYSIFYISIPSMISTISSTSMVGASLATINATALIGLYFMIIFFISYILSNGEYITVDKITKIKSPLILLSFKILAISIVLYITMVLFINFSSIMNVHGDRTAQSLLNTSLSNSFKIKPLFIILIFLNTYIVLQSNKIIYSILFVPFAFYDIMLSGREYLFSVLIVLITLNILLGHILKLRHIIFGIIAVASFAIFRITSEFEWGHLIIVFGEFNATWSTVHLMYDSSQSQDFFYAINYSLFRIFPTPVYEVLFGNYDSYTKITGESNPLGWGLAGSMVAEALSFKNTLITILFPLIVVIYGYIINLFFKSKTFSGVIIFIIALVYLQQMFRYSFLELAMYPYYVMLFFGFFIFGIDALKKTSIKGGY